MRHIVDLFSALRKSMAFEAFKHTEICFADKPYFEQLPESFIGFGHFSQNTPKEFRIAVLIE